MLRSHVLLKTIIFSFSLFCSFSSWSAITGDNFLCEGSMRTYKHTMNGLYGYHSVDLRNLAIASHYFSEEKGDRFIKQACVSALPGEYLNLEKDRFPLKEEDFTDPKVKYNVHNNIYNRDLPLYHMIYFPHQVYHPESEWVQVDHINELSLTRENWNSFGGLNIEAIKIWSQMKNLCPDSEGSLNPEKARLRFLLGNQLCGPLKENSELGRDLRRRIVKLHTKTKDLLEMGNYWRNGEKLHPLFTQVILNNISQLFSFKGALMRENNVSQTRITAINTAFNLILDNNIKCNQLGLWPIMAREFLMSLQSGATIIPGINDTLSFHNPLDRLVQLLKSNCGGENSDHFFYKMRIYAYFQYRVMNYIYSQDVQDGIEKEWGKNKTTRQNRNSHRNFRL